MNATTIPAAPDHGEIEKLRGLLAKATPGPWRFDGDWHRLPTLLGANGERIATLEKSAFPERYDRSPLQAANASLIPEAVNALPRLLALIEALVGERDAARAMSDRLRLEAQMHAGEARAHKSTVHEAYQAATGCKGEPGDWHGAQPIREALDAAEARADAAEGERDRLRAGLQSVINAADLFCDESGDEVVAQVKIRARAALAPGGGAEG